ncbi:MAG: hypothetical protein U0469_03245 [Candidatus Paceibacterota bacterium]|jgi:hypothetical protein
MTKRFFQRLLLTIIVLLAIFIHVPNIFKDALIILLSAALFLSTFDVYPKKKQRTENVVG